MFTHHKRMRIYKKTELDFLFVVHFYRLVIFALFLFHCTLILRLFSYIEWPWNFMLFIYIVRILPILILCWCCCCFCIIKKKIYVILSYAFVKNIIALSFCIEKNFFFDEKMVLQNYFFYKNLHFFG